MIEFIPLVGGVVFGVGVLVYAVVQATNTRAELTEDFAAFSESVRGALSANDDVRIEELNTRDAFALELSFPSSRHHSVLHLRPVEGGALQLDLKVPTREHIPDKISLHAHSSSRTIHLADQRIVQTTIALQDAEMDLNYWGHSITAKMFDLLRALVPDLLKALQRELELHQTRLEAFNLTSGALELRLVYPSSTIDRVDAVVSRMVALGAHAHLEDSSHGLFWNHLHFATPAGSTARRGAISSLMRHAPDSPEAHELHARILAHGELDGLRTLYEHSPHAFYSKMNRARLHHFVGRQLEDGDLTHEAIPEVAWNLLDADSLASQELPSSLRLDLYGRLLTDQPERSRELTRTLYDELDADARTELFERTRRPPLRHVLPIVVAAARAHDVVHASASETLAHAYARAIDSCVRAGEVNLDDALEAALARFTLMEEKTARIASHLLAEYGSANALPLLVSLQPQNHTPITFTHALMALKRRHLGGAHLGGAMTLAESPDDALRGALSANTDAGALTQVDDEDAT